MDKSLATLLRSLQTSNSYQDASRLLPPATTLLSALTNPLNITLLSSQLLTNGTLYPRPIELQNCRNVFSLFYTAALRVAQRNAEPKDQYAPCISNDAWARAVINGADDTSPRWRHLLLLGAVLLGLEGQVQGNVSTGLRAKMESALVTASNLALQEDEREEPNCRNCVVFVLNHTMGMLSDFHRAQLNYDLFLPLAIDTTFFSREGLEHGYWLGLIDHDVRQTIGRKFTWSQKSKSFIKVKNLRSGVLLSSLGALSRLIAHAIENTTDSLLVLGAMERIAEFARNLCLSWRQNKLSEVDPTDEAEFLDAEAIQATQANLWPLLRDIFFGVIIIQRATLGRLLTDPILASDSNAPLLAMQCLHTLRNLHFVLAKYGSTSAYTFVNYTAVDILSQFPNQAGKFLHAVRPAELGSIPAHPLDRNLDLFFLNTAEHFTLCLRADTNEELLLAAALPYLAARGNRQLMEIYEAAHSVALAVFAAPQNAIVAVNKMPFYLDSLLSSFPETLSSRQFRLAIKSVMRVAAPPSAMADAQPLLQLTILELLNHRACSASTIKLPPSPTGGPPMSERTALILAMLDSLSSLPVTALEDWLPRMAELVHQSSDPAQLSQCQTRFWEVLSGGEMDVERATLCVAWWNTRGGRESLLYNEQPEEEPEYMMSGALPVESKL